MQAYLIGPKNITPYEDAFKQSILRFKSLSPEEIADNTACVFHPSGHYFSLNCLHQTFNIYYPDGNILYQNTKINPPISWRLIMLNYFSSAKNIPLSRQWISYKEQPTGHVFYPSIVNTLIKPMEQFYKQADKKKLIDLLRELKFDVRGNFKHLIAEGNFAPRIPVQIHFWAGDDDFSAGFQILFDKTLSFQMHIEDAVVLCTTVGKIIRNEYELLD